MNVIDLGVTVSVRYFTDLFDKKIIIPEYQRPYIWGREKTEDLLKDFEEFFLNSDDSKSYYMGTIIYYFNKSNCYYEVIDGQQRITTLLIIKSLLSNQPLPDYQDVVFNSHQSIKYIQEAKEYFKENIESLKLLKDSTLL